MNLEKLFENDEFIIWKDNKGFDFAYGIENKTEENLIIEYGEDEATIEVKEWLGLFNYEENIINYILNGNYKIIEESDL